MVNDAAYPAELKADELARLVRRRAAAATDETAKDANFLNPADHRTTVGLALSGGGIRSATFALGVLQSLADLDLIRRIDFLSTVSGGGYIGSFFGALFARDGANPRAVTDKLRSKADGESEEIGWLRRNGRYLAPNGGSDAWSALASGLRGWAAVTTVIVLAALLAFLTLYPLRTGVEWISLQPSLAVLAGALRPEAHWASPFWLLVAPLALLTVIPQAWAYWSVEKNSGLVHPLMALILVWSGSATVLFCPVFSADSPVVSSGATLLLIVSTTTLIWMALIWCLVPRQAIAAEASDAGRAACSSRRDKVRRKLTSWLASSLIVLTGLVLLASIDSLGFLLYVLAHLGQNEWLAVVASATATALLISQRMSLIKKLLASFTGQGGFSLPSGLLIWLIAAVAGLGLLAVTNAGAHALAWTFQNPNKVLVTQPSAPTVNRPSISEVTVAAPASPGVTVVEVARSNEAERVQGLGAMLATLQLHRLTDTPLRLWPLGAWIWLVGLCFLLGRNWAFLNRSSHQALYAARLKRTYLGASNPARQGRQATSVTEAVEGDDFAMGVYWNGSAQDRGAPLHLVNVTINQTLSRREGTVNRDRQGIPMAVGPCAMSAGIRHHYLLESHHVDPQPAVAKSDYWMFEGQAARATPRSADAAASTSLADRVRQTIPAEEKGYKPLSLGDWVAISGAAFSTGTGYHTSLATSLLTGLANVRLGYWWRSGSMPQRASQGSRIRAVWHWLRQNAFKVQSYLLDELLARFQGPGKPYWYLSDGGHFENMGAYELIRRRVGVIVIVDGEADPDYQFEGLAGLVRKARTDFGAEIRFLDPADKDSTLTSPELTELAANSRFNAVFGPLSALAPDPDGYSAARASIATVTYGQESTPASVIIYLKPTLTVRTPADVREYQQRNRPFPQQPTLDQFFDEVQWESYRRLGLDVAHAVFAPAPQSRWCPHDLKPLPA